MKTLLGELVLLNRGAGAYEPAQLYREIDQKNGEDFEKLWRPLLANAGGAPAPDAHWKWAEKGQYAARSTVYETFALEVAGVTQGLMLVSQLQFARLEEQKGLELVYIELVATAPWNRPEYRPAPIYKGVGRVLLATAVSLSIENGFGGRLGLHALPTSERWYSETCGLSDLGYDDKKKMKYFEFNEVQAKAFLK